MDSQRLCACAGGYDLLATTDLADQRKRGVIDV
jgi:hypothetical protein